MEHPLNDAVCMDSSGEGLIYHSGKWQVYKNGTKSHRQKQGWFEPFLDR